MKEKSLLNGGKICYMRIIYKTRSGQKHLARKQIGGQM